MSLHFLGTQWGLFPVSLTTLLGMLQYNPNKVKYLLKKIKEVIIHFKRDSLFQNSVFLLTSTICMSGFGFIFWIITTRFYTTSQIGLATALISTTTLLSSFSLFGFNTGLVRYLSQSENRNRFINTSILIVSLITVVVSAVYVFLIISHIAPQFLILKQKPSYGILFTLFMITVSVNTLTDSIFVAYRAAKYNLIEYLFFGVAKIIFPLLLIRFGTYGIFFAYIGSVIAALFVTFYFLARKFHYKFRFVIDKDIIKKVSGFAVGNYIVTFLLAVPTLILPTIIIAREGALESAYFYIAATIVQLLYGVPAAIAQSLLAEGSHNEHNLRQFIKSASKLMGIILIAGVLAFIALSKYVLMIFGKEYSIHSRVVLIIMSLTSFFLAANTVGSTVLRIKHKTNSLISLSVGYVVITIFLIFLLLPHGIIGASLALLLGQAFMTLEFIVLLFFKKGSYLDTADSIS